jgi:hypothetical protein
MGQGGNFIFFLMFCGGCDVIKDVAIACCFVVVRYCLMKVRPIFERCGSVS